MQTEHIQQLDSTLKEAYKTLAQATFIAQACQAALTEDQRKLTEARQAILYEYRDDPKALGSNEAAREAAVQEATRNERRAVLAAEDALAHARYKLDLARQDVEGARAQLRLMEVYVQWMDISR